LSLNTQRSDILSILTSKDTFHKFKSYQSDIVEIESEIFRLKNQLENIDKIGSYKKDLETKKEESKDSGKRLISVIKNDENTTLDEINERFNSIAKEISDFATRIYIKENKNNNLDFETEITKNKSKTKQSEGYTAQKIQCVAFDLSVISYYSEKGNKLQNFIYHDGVFESLHDKEKVNLINLVKRYCDLYNIQYIMSAIDSDIPEELSQEISEYTARELNKDDTLLNIGF